MMASRSVASSQRQKHSVTSRKSMAGSLLVLLLVFLVTISSVSADPDVTYVSAWCSQVAIPDNSLFYNNLDALLHNIISTIDLNTGRWHTQSDNNNDANTVYGLATCTNVGYDDCKTCLQYIITDNLYLDICPPNVYGGQVTLNSCFLEYENYYIE